MVSDVVYYNGPSGGIVQTTISCTCTILILSPYTAAFLCRYSTSPPLHFDPIIVLLYMLRVNNSLHVIKYYCFRIHPVRLLVLCDGLRFETVPHVQCSCFTRYSVSVVNCCEHCTYRYTLQIRWNYTLYILFKTWLYLLYLIMINS